MESLRIFFVAQVLVMVVLMGNFGLVESKYVWTNKLQLSPEIEFKWDISDSDWMIGEVTALNVFGYVGLGFSETGGMPGADIMMAWFDEGGDPHLHDYYSVRNGAPIKDPKQDVILLESELLENGMRFIFRRRWDTCDEHDFKIQDDTVRVIWAWSDDLPVNETLAWHGGNRGVKSAFLKHRIGGAFRAAEKGEKYWDVYMKNHTVGVEKTHYFCKLFKFPKLTKKHHIIGYLPIIVQEHRRLIHHIALFQCHVPASLNRTRESMFEQFVDHPGAVCNSNTAPPEWIQYCFTFEISLNYGSEGQDFPTHVGRPIGEDSDEDNYFVLEVHYENPDDAPFVDSSGIRLVYTDNLRPFDTGALVLGQKVTPFTFIPPKQKAFRIKGFCSGVCTRKGFPETGITAFSVLLHGHTHTRSLILRHIRKGVELPPLAQDNNYDFNYQQYKRLPKEVEILPEDELIVECVYDNDSENYVVGGLSARREMCLGMIMHYPKSSLVDCRSQYEYGSFFTKLGINQVSGDILNELNLPYDPEKVIGDKDATPLDDANVLFIKTQQEEVNYTLFDDLYTYRDVGIDPQNVSVGSILKRRVWKSPQDDIALRWSNSYHYMHCVQPGGRRMDAEGHVKRFPRYKAYKSPVKMCAALSTHENEVLTGAASKKSRISLSTLVLVGLFYMGAFALRPVTTVQT